MSTEAEPRITLVSAAQMAKTALGEKPQTVSDAEIITDALETIQKIVTTAARESTSGVSQATSLSESDASD